MLDYSEYIKGICEEASKLIKIKIDLIGNEQNYPRDLNERKELKAKMIDRFEYRALSFNQEMYIAVNKIMGISWYDVEQENKPKIESYTILSDNNTEQWIGRTNFNVSLSNLDPRCIRYLYLSNTIVGGIYFLEEEKSRNEEKENKEEIDRTKELFKKYIKECYEKASINNEFPNIFWIKYLETILEEWFEENLKDHVDLIYLKSFVVSTFRASCYLDYLLNYKKEDINVIKSEVQKKMNIVDKDLLVSSDEIKLYDSPSFNYYSLFTSQEDEKTINKLSDITYKDAVMENDVNLSDPHNWVNPTINDTRIVHCEQLNPKIILHKLMDKKSNTDNNEELNDINNIYKSLIKECYLLIEEKIKSKKGWFTFLNDNLSEWIKTVNSESVDISYLKALVTSLYRGILFINNCIEKDINKEKSGNTNNSLSKSNSSKTKYWPLSNIIEN